MSKFSTIYFISAKLFCVYLHVPEANLLFTIILRTSQSNYVKNTHLLIFTKIVNLLMSNEKTDLLYLKMFSR